MGNSSLPALDSHCLFSTAIYVLCNFQNRKWLKSSPFPGFLLQCCSKTTEVQWEKLCQCHLQEGKKYPVLLQHYMHTQALGKLLSLHATAEGAAGTSGGWKGGKK